MESVRQRLLERPFFTQLPAVLLRFLLLDTGREKLLMMDLKGLFSSLSAHIHGSHTIFYKKPVYKKLDPLRPKVETPQF